MHSRKASWLRFYFFFFQSSGNMLGYSVERKKFLFLVERKRKDRQKERRERESKLEILCFEKYMNQNANYWPF